MRNLKPYTQFKIFEKSDSYLEDAKWIVISHLGEIQEIETENSFFDGELVAFRTDENPSDEDIKSCESHLNSEGFFLIRPETNIDNIFTIGCGDVNKVIQKIDISKYRQFERIEKINDKLDNIDTNHINSVLNKYKSIIKYYKVEYGNRFGNSTSIYGTPNTCYIQVNEENFSSTNDFEQTRKKIYYYSFSIISYAGWYYLVSITQRSRSVSTVIDAYRFKLEAFDNVINLLLDDIEKKNSKV